MASDSLFGGTDLSDFTVLSDDTKAVINAILGDTIGGAVKSEQLTGGGTLVSAEGSNGETQAVLISEAGQVIAATLKSGEVTLDVVLPAGMGMAFQGVDSVPPDQVASYMAAVTESFLPSSSTDPVVQAAREDLLASIKTLTESLSAAGGTSFSVRFVAITAEAASGGGGSGFTPRAAVGGDVVFDAGVTGTTSELLAMVMGNLKASQTLVLKNVESALLIGNGTARVDGSKGAMVSGGMGEQNITGSAGNDTLIGGTGRDTLTGGLGKDIFGIGAKDGKLTVTDFTPGTDMLGFKIDGVANLTDLSKLYTGLTHHTATATAPADTILNFGPDMSITLVGVSPYDLTLDMIKFTL
jgi:Ca2+-binding RTX toxin-like protein